MLHNYDYFEYPFIFRKSWSAGLKKIWPIKKQSVAIAVKYD